MAVQEVENEELGVDRKHGDFLKKGVAIFEVIVYVCNKNRAVFVSCRFSRRGTTLAVSVFS